MAVAKKFKTNAAIRHNVDLSEDDSLKENSYGWMPSYNQRASVRILTTGAANKVHPLADIKCIRFINTLDPSDKLYNVKFEFGVGLEDFYHLYLQGDEFKEFQDVALHKTEWDNVFSFLEADGIAYSGDNKGSYVNTRNAKSRELYGKLSIDQQMFLTRFEGALKCDMRNGEAKYCITDLITALRTTGNLSRKDIEPLQPPFYCGTNTTVEVINGKEDEAYTRLVLQEPFSIPRSTPSVSSDTPDEPKNPRDVLEKRHRVVPDIILLLPQHPGVFPLVVELKPALSLNEGCEQNIVQMLSKMVFQDVVLGLVLTPTMFCLLMITKTDNDVHVRQTCSLPLTKAKESKATPYVRILHVENFKAVCTFIYQVMMWSTRTKCSLKTSPCNLDDSLGGSSNK